MLKSWQVSLGFPTIFDTLQTEPEDLAVWPCCQTLPTDFYIIMIWRPKMLWRIFGWSWVAILLLPADTALGILQFLSLCHQWKKCYYHIEKRWHLVAFSSQKLSKMVIFWSAKHSVDWFWDIISSNLKLYYPS